MDKGFVRLERLIYATNIRQRVLASNIANSDTPDYRAKDVDFRSLLEETSEGLKTTSPLHIQSASGGTGTGGDIKTDNAPTWGDGNNVELDMEIAKMTENGLLYEAGIKLLSAKMRMFRNAVKGR